MDWSSSQRPDYGNRVGTSTAGNTPSLFGLISKVNQGILKKPLTSEPTAAASQPEPAQPLATGRPLIEDQKQNVFLEAKSQIEQIQKGLWKTEKGAKPPEPFKMPQLPVWLGKQAQREEDSSDQGRSHSAMKQATQTVKALTPLVEYDDDDSEELDRQGSSFNKEKALEEIDRYRAVSLQGRDPGTVRVTGSRDQKALPSGEYDRSDIYDQPIRDDKYFTTKEKDYIRSTDRSKNKNTEYLDAFNSSSVNKTERSINKSDTAIEDRDSKYLSSCEVFDYGHSSGYKASGSASSKINSCDPDTSSRLSYSTEAEKTKVKSNIKEECINAEDSPSKPRRFEEEKKKERDPDRRSNQNWQKPEGQMNAERDSHIEYKCQSGKEGGDMLYEDFLFKEGNSSSDRDHRSRSGSYERDRRSVDSGDGSYYGDTLDDRQRLDGSHWQSGYGVTERGHYSRRYGEAETRQAGRDGGNREERWAGSWGSQHGRQNRQESWEPREPANRTDSSWGPAYSQGSLGPGIMCQDCNITCVDNGVFEVHLKSDLHLLNVQKKAQEVLQMHELDSGMSCKLVGAEPYSLPNVPLPLPTATILTGLPAGSVAQPLVGYPIRPGVYELGSSVPPDVLSRAPVPMPQKQEAGFRDKQGRPPKPLGPLEAQEVGSCSVRVSWAKLPPDQQPLVEKYVVEYRNARETHWVTVGTTTSHDFLIDGLQELTDYLFRVFSASGVEKSEVLESVLVTTRRSKDMPSRRFRRPSPDRGRMPGDTERPGRDRSWVSREPRRSPADRSRQSGRDRPRTVSGDRDKPHRGNRERSRSNSRDRDSSHTSRRSRDKSRPDSGLREKSDRENSEGKSDRENSEGKSDRENSEGKKDRHNNEGKTDREKSEGKKIEEGDSGEKEDRKRVEEDVECLLYREIPQIEEQPLLGLEYLWEIVSYKPTVPVRYLCKLCNTKGCTSTVMIQHITGFPHKMEYFKQHDSTVHDTVTMIPNKKDQLERLNYEGSLVEDKHGRGAVKVMIMINPADTGGKVMFRDPIQVPAPSPKRDKVTGPVPEAAMIQSKFQSYFKEAVEVHELEDTALIGLSYLREYFHPTDEDEPPRYCCSLCNIMCTYKTVVFHVIGKKHRLAFLKVYEPEKWDLISKPRNNKKLIIERAAEIEKKEGPGEIKSMVAKNTRMWRHSLKKETSPTAEEDEEEETESRSTETVAEVEPAKSETTARENEEAASIKFGIKKSDSQLATVKPVNVLEQAKPKNKEAFDWNKENAALQAKIQNQTIIKSNRKSKFITVYSEFFKRYPVIGLQWVTEFQKPDPKQEPWYMCFLCQQRLPWKHVLDHVTSSSHRIGYMKKNYEDKYKVLQSTVSTNKTRGRVVVESFSREIMSQEGPITGMEVMLELSINTEALKSVMKVKESVKTSSSASGSAASGLTGAVGITTSSGSMEPNVVATAPQTLSCPDALTTTQGSTPEAHVSSYMPGQQSAPPLTNTINQWVSDRGSHENSYNQGERGDKRTYWGHSQQDYFEENKKPRMESSNWRKPDTKRLSDMRFDRQRTQVSKQFGSLYDEEQSRNWPAARYSDNQADPRAETSTLQNEYSFEGIRDRMDQQGYGRDSLPSNTDTSMNEYGQFGNIVEQAEPYGDYYEDTTETSYDLPLSTRDVDNLVHKYTEGAEDDYETTYDPRDNADYDESEYCEEWRSQQEIDTPEQRHQVGQYSIMKQNSVRERDEIARGYAYSSPTSRGRNLYDEGNVEEYDPENALYDAYADDVGQLEPSYERSTDSCQIETRLSQGSTEYDRSKDRLGYSDFDEQRSDRYMPQRFGAGHRSGGAASRYERWNQQGSQASNRWQQNISREPDNDHGVPKTDKLSTDARARQRRTRWEEERTVPPDPSREEIEELLKKVNATLMRMPAADRRSVREDLVRNIPSAMVSLDEGQDFVEEAGQRRSYRGGRWSGAGAAPYCDTRGQRGASQGQRGGIDW